MMGRRISKREVDRLARRVDELRDVQKALGATDVELLTALISLEDWSRARAKMRRDRGEDE